ncbi:MAG: membrane protein insertase YidC, partial [Exilibacterium sp.]
VAMEQHYFLSAWIPDQELDNSFKLRKAGDKTHYLLGFTSPQTEVAAGSKGVIKASFYAGPKDIDRLEQISPYLDLTVDYGWLWWIAKPLFHFLNFIYSLLGNWGLSIIVLTIIVKGLFFPLSAASYRSMAKMRKVQPLMAELKERYGDNRQKMSEELMKLYRNEKVNPFVLPLIMGATMWFQQKLNPTPADPTQARVMQLMPIVFTFMFLWFPAGLVLYWVVNNTLSIAQQYVITRQIEAADKK